MKTFRPIVVLGLFAKLVNCYKNDIGCHYDGDWYDSGKWYELSHKKCYCEYGKFNYCKPLLKCFSNGHGYSSGQWHELYHEKCYCKHGNWIDCKPLKLMCEWDGHEYDAGKWHDNDKEECYCGWDGEWEDCKPHHDSYDPPDHCQTITEIVCDQNSDYLCNDGDGKCYKSILCEALKKVGLDDTLDDKNAHFTVFSPTNKAFVELKLNLNDINKNDLKDVLLTHVVTNRVLDKGDLKHRCSDLLKMASGENTRTICKDNKHTLYQKGEGNSDHNKPKIINSNIHACNGIIHVVDGVILP